MDNAKLDAALAALAEPQRRRTVELLRVGPRRAGELATELGLSAPAMSRHLRILKQSGLVKESHPEFDSRIRIYTLKQEGMAAIKSWMDETEALWTRQLASFKEHIEGKS